MASDFDVGGQRGELTRCAIKVTTGKMRLAAVAMPGKRYLSDSFIGDNMHWPQVAFDWRKRCLLKSRWAQ
jgi:hypothetical protein